MRKKQKPKLRVVKGGGQKTKAQQPDVYLGIDVRGETLAWNVGNTFLEFDLLELANHVLDNPPGEMYDIDSPPEGAKSKRTDKIDGLAVLALLEDAVNFCAPEPEEWSGDHDYDMDDYDTRLLNSALMQLDAFLERKPIIALLHEGRLDIVREWYIDSVLNQPFWIDDEGKAHLREDTNKGNWLVCG